MNRRDFLIATATTAASIAATPPKTATVLYGGRSVSLDRVRSEGKELWVLSRDLPRINEFEVKPQGACRADLCIPLAKGMKDREYFNLTGFARKVGEAVVADAGVWSLGEIPEVRGSFYSSRVAPDFAVKDRTGRVVHLSDFRGKKALVVTWASW